MTSIVDVVTKAFETATKAEKSKIKKILRILAIDSDSDDPPPVKYGTNQVPKSDAKNSTKFNELPSVSYPNTGMIEPSHPIHHHP